ncbi:hypothetical protein ACFQ9V_10515 [Leifsonia sp. NPDC056665]|uniref:hypothetical protein n=1 Tax=Leifsonia sp. NPDC056665 TaxID=3345901 RepID=UPI003692B9CC
MERQPPEPKPWGASDDEAIALCREWMIYLGAADTVVASGDAVRACDLYSAGYLAWVDNERGNLDVAQVTRAASVSAADGRRGLIFVRHGVLPQAVDRADELGVAIFGFDPQGATLDGGNLLGLELCSIGLAR